MAGDGQFLSKLKQFICQYENGGGNGNGNGNGLECPPTKLPCATVCMVVPPPIMAPTVPQPVKPLQLPCPVEENNHIPEMSQEEAERTRYSNFYNNYNVDWHSEGRTGDGRCFQDPRTDRCKGMTTDGQTPCCEDYRKRKQLEEAARKDKGCPTGFKPCTMKLTQPPDCHPCGVWCAEIQPCPPKRKKKVSKYTPGECKRPCCKHWKPKDGPCKYDEPCKAHCFNHPVGIKPRREREQQQQQQAVC